MAKLSVIIPSRDERFLLPTIHDLFRNARGEFEVIAVLDSDKWPEGWKEITDQYPNLHTIHNGKSIGMRGSINKGVASAISRGAKFIMKSDGHCSFSEGFDEVLKAECEPNWVVVPRRGRLDPENWVATETHKPDIDYHYLSFPDDPNDWGGPGLNGKPWTERAVARKDILIDDEMSSQGSCWFMHATYFNELDLMDENRWGPFWSEFQEIGLQCWLSGGQVKVNKKAKYLHLHKGSKYGRGYRLEESALQKGRNEAMKWPWNESWPKQTLPFSWLIEHFWPVPSWPDNWEEILYATRKPREVPRIVVNLPVPQETADQMKQELMELVTGLRIHQAHYGVGGLDDIDVRERLQNLVFLNKDSLDIVVNNSTLTPGQNPFRGKKKQLNVTYSFNNGEAITRTVEEKDWLIIGNSPRVGIDYAKHGQSFNTLTKAQQDEIYDSSSKFMSKVEAMQGVRFGPINPWTGKVISGEPVTQIREPMTPAALNDYLIRKFSISPQRLRGPMPIELRDFHRNDLAQLFAELGFKRGAEIGVAEGNYSEVLLKANPECELLLVDPWHAYSDNPQNKTKEKHEYAYTETARKVMSYQHVKVRMQYSMDAVRDADDGSLDFVYIDGNHLFDCVMQDLIEWSKRVRSGGIVSGDDYYALDQKRWVGGGVVEAVQAYVNAHRIPIWYIFQGHKSVDFMWVKP